LLIALPNKDTTSDVESSKTANINVQSPYKATSNSNEFDRTKRLVVCISSRA